MRGWFQEAEASFASAVDVMDTAVQPGYDIDVEARVVREYMRAMLGWFCLRRGMLQEAELLLQSSLASLRSFATGIELADVLYYVGAITWMNGDYPRARAYFIEGLAVAEKIGNQWDVAQASIGMGIITQTVGEYEEANEHWQRALDISSSLGDQRAIAWVLNFSCILKRTLGAYAEAQTCLRMSLSLSESVGDRVTYGMALSQLGLVTQALGDNAQAIGMLIECIPLLRELGEFWSLLHALIGLGVATLSIGDYVASRDAYHEALQMAWEKQALPEVLEVMTGMARWSASQGAPEQALVNAIFVLNHQAASEQTKEVTRQLLTELEALLTSKQIHAAQGRVEAITFEEIVGEALTQINLA
jgi:tetratricopeptide (TPR) repeat protein